LENDILGRKTAGGKAEGSVGEGEYMNEDGYGASDKEQELNDLEEMSQKIWNLSNTIDSDYCELDDKYGFGIVEGLQEMSLTIDRKIEELRSPGEPEGEG
jgi:hypothetical protein